LCIEIAKELKIPESSIKKGLKLAKQPLRMEVVSTNPTVILDSAHNEEKMRTTVNSLKHSTIQPLNKNPQTYLNHTNTRDLNAIL